MQRSQIAIGGAVLAGGALALYAYTQKQRKNWQPIGVVSKMFIHPIKSCCGTEIQTAVCTQNGLYHDSCNILDRGFVITRADGTFITARAYPLMVKISTQVEDDGGILVLDAPGMEPVEVNVPLNETAAIMCRIWGEEIPGIDCGDEVAKWLQKYLSLDDLRLKYHPNSASVRPLCQRDTYAPLRFQNKNNGNSIYHDFSPYNILSEASILDVAERMEKSGNLNVRNFRPNFLISGCEPHNENDWTHFKVGTAEFKFAKHCHRCTLPNIDTDTGIMRPDQEPLQTMKTFRLCKEEDRKVYGTSPILGVNLGIFKTGTVSVGDVVYAC
nr:mitochondrial amidoxime reducing component 2 [Ciona intestinalis]|eukprot:XP_002129760.1 mitochondrial amidoxime reducing component 2 [Ciona intestinalis]